ncbi:MAG: hypothetical protein ACOYKG_07195 [Ilumatobacteraceae bacterium]
MIRELVSVQSPFTVHFCLPREFVLKMELVLMLADGFNDVSFHLAVGFVAATALLGVTSDEKVVISTTDTRAARRNRLFRRLFTKIALTLQLPREWRPRK